MTRITKTSPHSADNRDADLDSAESFLLEPERYELREEPRYRFEVDRRDFLKTLGGGIVVCLVAEVAGVARAQRPGGAAAEVAGAAEAARLRKWGLAAHQRIRRSHRLHGKGRNRAEHSHVA